MPLWKPEAVWDGHDVFIIGGGDSLRTFDWQLLKDERTIGCNTAFLLGVDICKVCIFGDPKWFKKFKIEVANYEGTLFTSHGEFRRTNLDWLWYIPRKVKGLGTDSLGWNNNTGANAINLALIMGAKRVFLLGFDMQLSKAGKANYHDRPCDKPTKAVYKKFLKGLEKLKRDLPKVFPGREIINITDDSRLNLFQKIGVKQFFEERRSHAT